MRKELEALSHYYPGAEARVRYGLPLHQLGRKPEAKVVFTELLIQMNRAPKYLRDTQKDWLSSRKNIWLRDRSKPGSLV